MTHQEDYCQISTQCKSDGTREGKKITPLNSIRAYCLWCCCESKKDVRQCSAKCCTLYPFRLGKNPFQKRKELTVEEKQKISNRLRSSKLNGNT